VLDVGDVVADAVGGLDVARARRAFDFSAVPGQALYVVPRRSWRGQEEEGGLGFPDMAWCLRFPWRFVENGRLFDLSWYRRCVRRYAWRWFGSCRYRERRAVAPSPSVREAWALAKVGDVVADAVDGLDVARARRAFDFSAVPGQALNVVPGRDGGQGEGGSLVSPQHDLVLVLAFSMVWSWDLPPAYGGRPGSVGVLVS
jgi:hypothetical protein